ncbi:Transposase [Cordylochernes scorpioides]|uniref:Transposase n=1 Tax=Cordylochernes scorpioides TaxID=51811 RepID=A0ABY6L1W7_9ARAC|nr:Transposase [Cordylochernes scorpioides]
MEEQTNPSNDTAEQTIPKQETTLEEEETSPPQDTSADPLTQIADALSKLLVARSPREIDVSPYDGTFEAQSFFDNFDAQADRTELTYTDRLRKLPCYLQENYYQNKTVMGMKLDLPADILIESLTDGLPVADQRLVATVQPNTIKEWFDLVVDRIKIIELNQDKDYGIRSGSHRRKNGQPYESKREETGNERKETDNERSDKTHPGDDNFRTDRRATRGKIHATGSGLTERHPRDNRRPHRRASSPDPVQQIFQASHPKPKTPQWRLFETKRMPGHRKRRQFKQTDAFTMGHGDRTEKGRTISRRLVANGLHSWRPLRRLPLTPPNRRQHLEWCRARSTWMTEWHRVVFSDESRFCLSSDSRRVRVWRRRGERSNPAAIVKRPTVRQRGIMVWGAIAYDSRSPLLRIQGNMTAQRYVDDVLRPVTLPYLQGVPNALYQQDDARPHTARISQQALQDVQMLPWPPYSPDLSPIEHVWDIIGRRLHALPQPRSEDELWQMVEREWRAIPQDAIRTLIDSLPRRVAACIAVRGGPTCY